MRVRWLGLLVLGLEFLAQAQAPTRYVASQGTRLGRAGRVHIAQEGETVWVGGDTVSCVRGSASF
jgi:predicted PhzF superfamily epimerase YddE/YHI9